MQGSPATFRRRLLGWFHAHRRDLPWRLPRGCKDPAVRLDSYHVLVSELMLQQTQVATVIPYFRRFIERFPTFAALAAAEEQEVLRLWQGLGYYSRARNLRKAALQVMAEHDGKLPSDVAALRELPGVGRYTAGAVASIGFDRPAPILDANVTRIFCRLDRIAEDARHPAVQDRLWAKAQQLLPRKRVGDFNSALMELGALICTPRSPRCISCPVRSHCDAFGCGVQEKIPVPRRAKPKPLLKRWTFCIHRGDRWLIEQRPPRGRWAGMWQFITIEAEESTPTAASLVGKLPVRISQPKPQAMLTHELTHRRYEFSVYSCDARTKHPVPAHPARWIAIEELSNYPLPRPHLRIAKMIRR